MKCRKFHPVLKFSGNCEDEIKSVLFEAADEGILQADECEVEEYQRIETVFRSGRKGFVHIGR